MKKIRLTESQSQQVISLRDSGLSWVKIQEKTGVLRRVAKRSYDEWYEKRSQGQLEQARREVVTQECRIHLDMLSRLAILLTDSLVLPDPVTDRRKSAEVWSQFLATDIYQEYPSYRTGLGERDREKRVIRMNELLLKSLQDHTRIKVPWEDLEEWKVARDGCLEDMITIRKEIREVLGNVVKHGNKLKHKIDNIREHPTVLDGAADGILAHLWLKDVMRSEGKVAAMVGVSSVRQGTAWVNYHEQAATQTEVLFDSEDRTENVNSAKALAEMSDWAIANLRRGKVKLVRKMRDEVSSMREAVKGLEEALNPLVLRPMILNTRCAICPV
jgi:hypothetical protein